MRTIKNLKSLNILFFFLWISIVFILFCFDGLGIYNFHSLVKIVFSCFFIMLLLKTLIQNEIFSIYFLFLGFSIFFIYSRLFFDFIGYAPINKTVFMRVHYSSDETIIKFLLLSIVFYLFIDIGYYAYHKNMLKKAEPVENKFGKKIAFLFFLLFSIIFFYKCLLDIKAMHFHGYTSNVKDIRSDYPFWTAGSGTFFYIFFYLFLMYKRSKAETIFVILLYLMISFSSGLKGARAAFFIPFVFSLYYLHKNKIINITLKKLLMIGFLSLFGIYAITISRGDNLDNIKNIGDLARYVFYYQGTTIGLPLYYIEFKDYFDNISNMPYILSDLIHLYYEKIKNGGYIVSAFVNIHHIQGAELGECFLLELLNLPFFLSCFVCIFIGRLINFTEQNFTRNIYFAPLLISMMSGFFYIPRNSLFCFLVPTTVMYLFVTNFFFVFENSFERFIKSKKVFMKSMRRSEK